MPTVRQIEEALYALAPRSLAMEWDNVGLLAGDPEQEVSRILVALDVTQTVADEAAAAGAQLIVAHHPVMNCTWHPVQTLREDTAQGRLLRTLVRRNVSAICMHTNLDIATGGVNDMLAYVLQLEDPGPIGEEGLLRCGTVRSVALRDFVQSVCGALHCGGVRYADGGKPVHRVAVGGGACGEYRALAKDSGCDTFVTADLKYHDFQEATQLGINLIDAGHFPTEDPVCDAMIRFLQARFPQLTIEKSTSHRDVIEYYVEGE